MIKRWIKVSLRALGVDSDEAAGALADLMGLPVETGQDKEGNDLLHVWLEDTAAARQTASALPDKLSDIFPHGRISLAAMEGVEDQDWLAIWRQGVKPLPLGERIIVSPTFAPPPPGHGRVEVTLDPGMAFGSGHHATTAMCAALLEKYIAPAMLDIGCGAGILAIIGAKLGANRALAIDIDPEAVRVTRENLALNQAESQVEAREGGPEEVNEPFGVITANLFLEPHLFLASHYWRLLNPRGALILSGIRLEQARMVLEKMTILGFNLAERMDLGEWSALVFIKPAITK